MKFFSKFFTHSPIKENIVPVEIFLKLIQNGPIQHADLHEIRGLFSQLEKNPELN